MVGGKGAVTGLGRSHRPDIDSVAKYVTEHPEQLILGNFLRCCGLVDARAYAAAFNRCGDEVGPM
jgi:hypothetical protein